MEEKNACAISSWYPRYRTWTIPTTLIPLSSEFVQFLIDDGVTTPSDPSCSPWTPSLYSAMESALDKYCKEVFIKLNWSAPRDGKWILGSMKCINIEDILLLLQSSDFIVHDICHAYDHCHNENEKDHCEKTNEDVKPLDQTLAIRSWTSNLRSSLEFRCFISNDSILGISQRSDTVHAFLRPLLPELFYKIVTFLQKVFSKKPFQCDPFVVDVALQEPNYDGLLMDFNVWHSSTDGGTFAWTELESRRETNQGLSFSEISKWNKKEENCHLYLKNNSDVFRILSSNAPSDSLQASNLHGYRVPLDFHLEALHTPEGMAKFLDQVTLSSAQDTLVSKWNNAENCNLGK